MVPFLTPSGRLSRGRQKGQPPQRNSIRMTRKLTLRKLHRLRWPRDLVLKTQLFGRNRIHLDDLRFLYKMPLLLAPVRLIKQCHSSRCATMFHHSLASQCHSGMLSVTTSKDILISLDSIEDTSNQCMIPA